MNSSRYERAREIFDRAAALPAREREDFLREACAGDSALREQVGSLLDAHRRMGDFLEDPAPTWTGQRIDRFTVERVLAEGGMGIVLQASQDHPRRTVAMKLIRGSRLSETSVQRFVMEAEALGRLDHPGIARIYEAGMAEREDRSFPYFVMELIEGLPLMEFARRRDLGEAERLELMIDICEAVHHAHLRGVIHRDLKPSNILVREDGQPKVLDFGVARITDADVQLTTVNTQVGQVLGTLPYMSPEQVRGDNEALDLRSDVYALGVLTFEILTGRLPQPLHRTELVEAVRMITQDSPDSLGGSSRSFDADLETIAAKCLRKEPAERYSSALDLATDLRRYLDHEPITARPPSLVYQIRRFARRNRVVVAWAVTSLVLLLGGLGVSLAGWSTAHQERDRALASAREATELSDLLVDLLSSPDPRQDGADVRVRDLLEVASERADSALSDHPRAAARLHQALGLSYRGLGLHRQARAELTQAVTRARELPPDLGAASVVEALLDLSNLTFEMGQAEVTDSLLTAVEERLDGVSEKPELRFRLSLQRGMRARQQRQLESAETQLRQASTEAEGILGADHPVSRDLVSELAYTLWSQGRADEAAQLFERSLASDTRILGPDHPATLKSANNLGRMYQQLGNLDRAQELLRRTLDAKIRRLGPDHPSTGTGHHNLGLVLHDMGELDEALDHHLLAVAIADSFLTHEDSRWAHSHAALAKTHFAREEFGEARRHYELSLGFLEEHYGIEHPELQRICGELATSCEAVGDLDAARRWRARVLADE